MLAPVMQLQRAVPEGRWSPFVRNHDQVRTRTELGGDLAKAKIAATILLTLPGMPFVYYGEEIGMIGVKPDERLRTPMQWSSAHGGGFTTGTPWEQLQSDSLTTTVAAEERDAGSILALHRRLIHLRDRCSALSQGGVFPMKASDDAVVAYLREDNGPLALVIANLSERTLGGVSVNYGEPLLSYNGAHGDEAGRLVIRPGKWKARDLLGHESPASLVVKEDGHMQDYVPLPTLAPKSAHVFELTLDAMKSCRE
jgi:glycosidase